jgi:hypothetical protein
MRVFTIICGFVKGGKKSWGSAPSFSRLGIQTGLSVLGLSKTLGLRARRFLASTYKQVCLFSAYRKR